MNDKKIEIRKWGDHVVECDVETVLAYSQTIIDKFAQGVVETADRMFEESIIDKFCEIIKEIPPIRKNIALRLISNVIKSRADETRISEGHLIPDEAEFNSAMQATVERAQDYFSDKTPQFTDNGIEWQTDSKKDNLE